ncbi:MAG: hypothetical protein ACOVNU_00950 [Candidatus Kapaibacteriota bacterium]
MWLKSPANQPSATHVGQGVRKRDIDNVQNKRKKFAQNTSL